MSVEQSGHQPWLYEPGTTDPLDEQQFDAFGERTLITPPVEPAIAAPAYEGPGRHHTPSWAHEPYTEVDAFTAPLHTLEPAFGEPFYAQVFSERNPAVLAAQATRPTHKPMATGVQVMSLQDRGPLVKDGEQGSIFDAMNRERSTKEVKDYYAELRRPYNTSPPSFEQMSSTPERALAVVQQEAVAPQAAIAAIAPVAPASREIAIVTPVAPIEPETPRTIITVKGEQEGSVAAVIEEEKSGLDQQEVAAFLTRVLRGLEKSRDTDLRAGAEIQAYAEQATREAQAQAAKAAKEAEAKLEAKRIAEEEQLARDIAIFDNEAPQNTIEAASTVVEQTPLPVVHEERLTLSGLRVAAKEMIGRHKKAARVAEYAGAAAVTVIAGARLFGRLRRR